MHSKLIYNFFRIAINKHDKVFRINACFRYKVLLIQKEKNRLDIYIFFLFMNVWIPHTKTNNMKYFKNITFHLSLSLSLSLFFFPLMWFFTPKVFEFSDQNWLPFLANRWRWSYLSKVMSFTKSFNQKSILLLDVP